MGWWIVSGRRSWMYLLVKPRGIVTGLRSLTGPSAFSYDVLANYVSEKLDIPIVQFEMEGFHDFRHSLAKSSLRLAAKYVVFSK